MSHIRELTQANKLSLNACKMVHGFEKLEKLFAGSRRRGRGRERPTQQQQNASMLVNRRPSSPMFPAPSYLRPTSMHMTPRDAHIDGPEGDMSRCQSVPTIHEALNKRSSIASSVTIVNRPGRSDPSVSSSQHSNKNSPTKSRSSRFRFPEDSLFRNRRPIGSSGDSNDALREQSPSTSNTETGLLDWTPTHVSVLFNPLEFKALSNRYSWEHKDNSIESTLLPSPDFVSLVPGSDKSLDNPSRQTVPRSSLLSQSPAEKLTLNLRQQSMPSSEMLLIDCVSGFDPDKVGQKPTINRSMSLNGLNPPRPSTARAILMGLTTPDNLNDFRCRRSIRESWGNRLEDSKLRSTLKSNSDGFLRSKLQRPASTSTLSTSTSQIPKCSVLKEPTFDDFYALSDEDIAESQPPTRYVCVPPTPPHRHICNSYRKSHLSQTPASRLTTFKPVHEDLTPPTTPTNYHLLALTYSPANPRDTLGALRAAELAKKYDFAVLYVLSLWPVDGDRHLDASPTAVASGPGHTNAPAMGGYVAPTKTANISGRLLAAYGLNEVPSPFEIVTDTHLAALNCDYWNEYRNVDARPDDISRGWIRPFYSEYTPAFGPSRVPGRLFHAHPKNRGIVFAAYSKQTFNPVIPMSTSAKQAFLLRQLYADAKALVETLIEPTFELRKATSPRQDIRNSISKV
ncbi:hypothetical protein F5Y09DRAFT_262429 [Xylaria sp. FL1042]|nr:hypothetical protein F5Y09DRAFT_262429 [Xylaria sp. FL1042]